MGHLNSANPRKASVNGLAQLATVAYRGDMLRESYPCGIIALVAALAEMVADSEMQFTSIRPTSTHGIMPI
ncbi:MAG: hypothetical protein WBL63_09725 [Candidatus Acidiferrum sp.]